MTALWYREVLMRDLAAAKMTTEQLAQEAGLPNFITKLLQDEWFAPMNREASRIASYIEGADLVEHYDAARRTRLANFMCWTIQQADAAMRAAEGNDNDQVL